MARKTARPFTEDELVMASAADRLIYLLPLEGEDDWWMCTREIADDMKRSMHYIHQRLVNYRDQGVVEQMREPSPKRPGKTRYFMDHDGARWRLRSGEARQEQQDEGGEGLTTEEQMVLDATLNDAIHAILSWKTGLAISEVERCLKDIRQRLGNEV